MRELRVVTSTEELQAALRVRARTFVEEMGVPAELEHDAADATATHVVALQDGRVVATGRLLLQAEGRCRIGRMAVVRELRGRGLGTGVLSALEDEARRRGMTEAVLHAQVHARDFYARLGYTGEGGEFTEAGLRHIVMTKRL